MSSAATVFPIPQAPLVDSTGRVTPAWFRFFISLVQRTGGTGGRVTPLPAEPFQVGLFDFGRETEDSAQMQLALSENQQETDPQLLLNFAQTQAEERYFFPQNALPDKITTRAGILQSTLPITTQKTPSRLHVESVPQLQPLLRLFLPAIGSPAAPEAITVGASVYSYSPGFDGFATVSGGTVSLIRISRNGGTTAFSTGEIAGIFPLTLADTLMITYSVVPTLTFFRR